MKVKIRLNKFGSTDRSWSATDEVYRIGVEREIARCYPMAAVEVNWVYANARNSARVIGRCDDEDAVIAHVMDIIERERQYGMG